nr:MAG TPA: hypothetical protein [Caudoviricetes sp.]
MALHISVVLWKSDSMAVALTARNIGLKVRWKKMKDIKNITVNYDNNESKIITKGLVIDFGKLDNDEGDVCFNMCNIKGKDLRLIVTAVVALAQKLGMLDEESEVD